MFWFRGFLAAVLLLQAVEVQSYQAVISMERNKGNHHYITFLDASHDIHSQLKIGRTKSAVIGQWDSSGKNFWYTVRIHGEASYSLVGYDVDAAKEIARIDIGKRNSIFRQLRHFWFQFSDDDSALFVLTQEKGRWYIDTYDTENFALTSRIELDKGDLEISKVAGDRLVVVSLHLRSSNRVVYVLAPKRGEVLFQKKTYPSEEAVASMSADKEFVYLLTKKVKRLADPKDLSRIIGYNTFVSVLDVATGEATEKQELGYDLTPLKGPEGSPALYGATHKLLTKPGGTLWRFQGKEISAQQTFTAACEPTTVLVNESAGTSTILCEETALQLAADSGQSTPVKVAAQQAMYTQERNAVFFLEKSGSQIGKLDLEPFNYVGDFATGRRGVKVGNAMLSVLSVAVVAYTGVGLIVVPNFSHTAMMTDHAEQRVYGMNLATGDVTVLDAGSFEKLGIVRTGAGSFALSRYDQSENVFAYAVGQVSVFNPKALEPVKILEQGSFAGANGDLDTLYWGPKDGGLEVYSISTLDRVANLPDLYQVQLVVTPGEEPYRLY